MVAGVTIEAASNIIMWQQGADKVQYSGTMTGTWKGAVTCWPYAFSPAKATSYVDKRDVAKLLEWRDADGVAIFEVV